MSESEQGAGERVHPRCMPGTCRVAGSPATPDPGNVEVLTVEQASELVGDDIAYWLSNPFMDPEMIAGKVCFWLDAVRRKAASEALTEAAFDIAHTEGGAILGRYDAMRWLLARAARIGGDS